MSTDAAHLALEFLEDSAIVAEIRRFPGIVTVRSTPEKARPMDVSAQTPASLTSAGAPVLYRSQGCPSTTDARIQVEHLLAVQMTVLSPWKGRILIAQDERLDALIEMPKQRSHPGIKCRTNIENATAVTPHPGRATGLSLSRGIGTRADTADCENWNTPPPYRSQAARLIPDAEDRPEQLSILNRAQELHVVKGIPTSLPIHESSLAVRMPIRSGVRHEPPGMGAST